MISLEQVLDVVKAGATPLTVVLLEMSRRASARLKAIEAHLATLNGTVAKHEAQIADQRHLCDRMHDPRLPG